HIHKAPRTDGHGLRNIFPAPSAPPSHWDASRRHGAEVLLAGPVWVRAPACARRPPRASAPTPPRRPAPGARPPRAPTGVSKRTGDFGAVSPADHGREQPRSNVRSDLPAPALATS